MPYMVAEIYRSQEDSDWRTRLSSRGSVHGPDVRVPVTTGALHLRIGRKAGASIPSGYGWVISCPEDFGRTLDTVSFEGFRVSADLPRKQGASEKNKPGQKSTFSFLIAALRPLPN